MTYNLSLIVKCPSYLTQTFPAMLCHNVPACSILRGGGKGSDTSYR